MDYQENDYVEEFGLTLKGRLWQIYAGINVDEASRDKYLELWRRNAKLSKHARPVQQAARPVQEPKKGCGCGK